MDYMLSIYKCDDNEDTLDIATISLAYSNSEVFAMLKKRGNLMLKSCEGCKQKLVEIDKAIDHLKDNKQEQYSKVVSAFITFKHSEGFERVLKKIGASYDFLG